MDRKRQAQEAKGQDGQRDVEEHPALETSRAALAV